MCISYQNSIEGRGGPTSLDVAQDGDPCVKTQAADHQLGRQAIHEVKKRRDKRNDSKSVMLKKCKLKNLICSTKTAVNSRP